MSIPPRGAPTRTLTAEAIATSNRIAPSGDSDRQHEADDFERAKAATADAVARIGGYEPIVRATTADAKAWRRAALRLHKIMHERTSSTRCDYCFVFKYERED